MIDPERAQQVLLLVKRKKYLVSATIRSVVEAALEQAAREPDPVPIETKGKEDGSAVPIAAREPDGYCYITPNEYVEFNESRGNLEPDLECDELFACYRVKP